MISREKRRKGCFNTKYLLHFGRDVNLLHFGGSGVRSLSKRGFSCSFNALVDPDLVFLITKCHRKKFVTLSLKIEYFLQSYSFCL